MSTIKFNANSVPQEEKKSFGLLPKGKYLACVVSSETKATKRHDGEYLNLQIEILEGEFKGRRLFDIILLSHPSESALQIAQQKLASLCRAVGVLTPEDSEELHNKPLMVSVGVKYSDFKGEDDNVISGYSSEKEESVKKTTPLKKKPLHASLPKEEVSLDNDEIPF